MGLFFGLIYGIVWFTIHKADKTPGAGLLGCGEVAIKIPLCAATLFAVSVLHPELPAVTSLSVAS